MCSKMCIKCGETKLLNLENFEPRKLKDSIGFKSYCRQCRRKSRIGEYQRNKPTEMKREHSRGYAKMYTRTIKGRCITALKSYRRSDAKKGMEFNLTQEWFIENVLTKECHYCKSTSQIGADRIDNLIGHTTDNTIPCCAVCNSIRSDIFTVEEMIIIGDTVKNIREQRIVSKTSGMYKHAKVYKPYKKVEIVNMKVA